MNLVDIIAKNSRTYPNETAFVEVKPVTKLRKEIQWRPFDEKVNKIANALKEMGVHQGDRVLLFGRNSINWLEVYFGVLKTGAWIAPLNYRFTNEDIAYCAKVSQPVVCFCDEEFSERMMILGPNFPTLKKSISMGEKTFEGMEDMESLIGRTSSKSFEAELRDEDPCGLYFTSGTTGAPKPILLTQKNLFCSGVTEAANHLWKHGDSLLMIPPLYHSAIGHLLGPMVVGARSVLLTEAISPQVIFDTMSKEQLSVVFLLVPWTMDILGALDRGDLQLKDYDLNCWRLMHMGAQPIPAVLIRRWKAYFPEMQYDTCYGLTEGSGPGVVDLGIGNERKIGAIGKPSLMWDLRIVDDRDEDVKQGQVGEIIVKGNGVMKEYYQNPELTAQTIRNGWLHTGDLGRMDEEGFIYIVDRKKDLVISGGENIYPVEIEAIILKHPKVRDAAVIGSPDERLGEVVTAVVEPAEGETLTKEEVSSFCEKNLPRYKRPRHIFFDRVPRSPSGKIEKPKLRDKYGKPK
ncbi:MAG TPA: class I adenylate-forming enzyme family protein [Thermodesulfobacteriota bacterium]|nr:class I adenylate-forming enzyme family protein [Thermodesulfobacteriota bacterium]